MTIARAIAAAQTIPVPGGVEGNVAQHLRLVHTAAEERAQILVFPELSLTGYELALADDLAFSERDPRLAPFLEAASSCSMILVVGAPIRIDSRLHIGAFIVFPDRSVEIYTKHHLGGFSARAARGGVVPPAESTVFHPGDRNPLVRFGGNTAAVAVCADIGRPSHPQAAAARGARTYLASVFIIPSDFEGDTAKLRAYAARHTMAVLMANFGGSSGGLASDGRSAIWSETGELLAQLAPVGGGVVIAVETGAGWRAKTVMLGGSCAKVGR
jgi:predicted amidohydrolase